MVWGYLACYDPGDGSPSDTVEDGVEVDGDDGDVARSNGGTAWVDGAVTAYPEHHEALTETADDEAFLATYGFDGEHQDKADGDDLIAGHHQYTTKRQDKMECIL